MLRSAAKAVALVLGLSATVHAAPAITNISGTFSGNADTTASSTITITGTGFGSKSPAAPVIWATFEASTQPTALGQATSWTTSEHMTSTTTNPAAGSKAICSDDSWLTDPSNKEWNVQYDFNQGYGAKYFISYDRRVTYTEGSGSGNWKWQRWWESEGSQPDFYVGTQGNFDQTVQVEGPGTVAYLNGSWIHPADRGKTWTKEEYRWQLNSSAGASDGGWKIWMWDTNKSSANWKSDSSGSAGSPDHMFIEDDPSNFTPAWSFSYLDNVYADNTWSRVVIGSSSTYDASFRREMCIPLSWSSTSITCYPHKGGFATGTTTYIFVCDSNDSCNATGTQLVIGGGAGNAAPTVNAGTDQSITLPAQASLDATASDDVAVVSSTWTKASGPGTVTFGDANAIDTTATFSQAGTYDLTITVADGAGLTASDTVTITVAAAATGVPVPNQTWRGTFTCRGGFTIK